MGERFEDRFWQSADGLSLHYRDYPGPDEPQGEPVLCLHGLTRNARDFHDLALHLAQHRRVLVPEMRGRGESDYATDPASYAPPQYVDDVERLLDELAIERLVIVGTSLGGLMAMLMAQDWKGRGARTLSALVLNDIGPEIEPAGLERIAGYVGQGRSYPTWLHAARSLCEVHSDAYPGYELDDWLAMAKRTLTVSQNGRIAYDYDMGIAEPFSAPGGAKPANMWLAYEALRDVPTLLIRGELSDLLSVDTAERMGARHSGITQITVPQIGHAPTLDEPEARAAIDALLAQI
ncbi:MAG: alpha/beta hydrolase [Erythrobacter sp.]|jgi:pimeloyl-ACP methyl ester carboxylesterase|nr:alpha/beta hydrolase [Erythrobacter sp.]